MNVDTMLSIAAFGTSEGALHGWDTRGRDSQMSSLRDLHDDIKQQSAGDYKAQYRMQRSRLNALVQNAKALDKWSPSLKSAQVNLTAADGLAGKGNYKMATVYQDVALQHVHAWLRSEQGTLQAGGFMNIETLLSIYAARGCKGPNCGRKGKKAGAKPLRSYMTKQETDTLLSKALKVKVRRMARKRY